MFEITFDICRIKVNTGEVSRGVCLQNEHTELGSS